MTRADNTTRQKSRIAALSVASNTTLVTLKIVLGVAIGSVSVISEAIHSAIDLVAAIVAFVAVRISGQPADEEHPFGHGKVENVSGAFEAILIFAAAAWIVREAILKLFHPPRLDMIGWGVLIMLVSTALNALVSRALMKVGKETDSIALRADAWHLRTDVYTSAGVMVGLAVIWVGSLLAPNLNLRWIDPIAAIYVALLIVRAAWDLTVESLGDLLDARIPREEEALIREHLAQFGPAVRGFHGLRTRKAGAVRYIEFHLIVDKDITVAEAHKISERISAALEEHFHDAHVIDHIEPCDGTCEPECQKGCLLSERERRRQESGRKLN